MKRPEDLSGTKLSIDKINVKMDPNGAPSDDLSNGLSELVIKDQQVRAFLEAYPELKTPGGLRDLERHSKQMQELMGQNPIVTPPDSAYPKSRPPKRVKR